VNGEILPGLNVNLNYAFTDSKVSEDAPGDPNKKVGNVTPNTAAHITNAWLNYRIGSGALTGFGITGGLQWQAERYMGTTKVANMPNYFRVDGGIGYQRGKYNVSL